MITTMPILRLWLTKQPISATIHDSSIFTSTNILYPGKVGHTFHSKLERQKQADLCEYKANMIYSFK